MKRMKLIFTFHKLIPCLSVMRLTNRPLMHITFAKMIWRKSSFEHFDEKSNIHRRFEMKPKLSFKT